MKLLALTGGARRNGNCYQLAQTLLRELPHNSVDYEIVELADKRIYPCQGCECECLQQQTCPLQNDDVPDLWQAMWHADVLLWVVPTYGGTPPALWQALLERVQGLFGKAPASKTQFHAIIVLANQLGASFGEFTPQIMRSILEMLPSESQAFLQLQPRQYQDNSLTRGLADHPEVWATMAPLRQRILSWVSGEASSSLPK